MQLVRYVFQLTNTDINITLEKKTPTRVAAMLTGGGARKTFMKSWFTKTMQIDFMFSPSFFIWPPRMFKVEANLAPQFFISP